MGSAVARICSPCGAAVRSSVLKSKIGEVLETDIEEAEPIARQLSKQSSVGPIPTGDITLGTLQGDWVNSVGAKIRVEEHEVFLNGIQLKNHRVELDEEGNVVSVGKLWQLNGWCGVDQIEFKEAPSREAMDFARSIVWTLATESKMAKWKTQMQGLGYAGTVADPLNRGVEGCCPGSCDARAAIPVENDQERDKAELALLNELISKHRYAGLLRVPPAKVIPDYSNRGHTGISVEHVHYLARDFQERGFQKRSGDVGHDIPVVVRQPANTEMWIRSRDNWRSKVSEEAGFPPMDHYEKLYKEDEFFTSLGNGHFYQALNLFVSKGRSIYSSSEYAVGEDQDLREAVEVGVPAIALKPDVPLRDRETISRLLNSKREYKWNVLEDGSVNILDCVEDESQCRQFEALSKVLDAVELNCLVRTELGISDSHRIGQ